MKENSVVYKSGSRIKLTGGALTIIERRILLVLGIDPGLKNIGFAVVEQSKSGCKPIEYGVIVTDSAEKKEKRLLFIYEELMKIVAKFRPDEAAMEALYFARNVTSALSVAEAKGVIALAAAKNDIPLSEYKPNEIKKAVSGSANADKKTVEKYVRLLLHIKEEIKVDHTSDALACALTHLHSSAMEKKNV